MMKWRYSGENESMFIFTFIIMIIIIVVVVLGTPLDMMCVLFASEILRCNEFGFVDVDVLSIDFHYLLEY